MERIQDLIEALPPGTITTHHGELAARATDRWALAMLQAARGTPPPMPTAVAFPTTTDQVSTVLSWARGTGTAVIPRGAGTGVAGGAQAVKRSIVLDLSHLNRILDVDEVSQVVECQAGVRGLELEAALGRRGLTAGQVGGALGSASVGGWIASASAGVALSGYGAVDGIVLGLAVALADGSVIRLPPVPRSGAGPDLRRLLVGSEGTLGVIVEAWLAVARAPAAYGWEALRPRTFEGGLGLLREIAQRPYRPLAVRLFDAASAARLTGGPAGAPLLVAAFDSGAPGADAERFELRALARELGARPADPDLARRWWEGLSGTLDRYLEIMGPERAEGPGMVTETVDMAGMWRRVPRLYDSVRGALLGVADTVEGEVAPSARTGAVVSFRWRAAAGDDKDAERVYREAWEAMTAACRAAGGTIAHHQGVGLLRVPFLAREMGDAGVSILRSVKQMLDPTGVLNPGKLIPPAEP